MAKTKPIGVRFDEAFVIDMKKQGLKTHQEILNFMTELSKKEGVIMGAIGDGVPDNLKFKKASKKKVAKMKCNSIYQTKGKESYDAPQEPEFKNDIEKQLWELQQSRLNNNKK
jgi:hypothetical protein